MERKRFTHFSFREMPDMEKDKLAAGPGPIGVFDSGYGGLTILDRIRRRLPQYDYIYLGDNARAPYGSRSFEIVYRFTLQAVEKLFSMGCHLVILACNTASAKALRSIQQHDLPLIDPHRRVLGVIRPTVEMVGDLTSTRHVGVLATSGTVKSQSYKLELDKLYEDITVTSMACPMWVPLIEYGEYENEGADYFIRKYIDRLFTADPLIDTLILGCTHYPIIAHRIEKFLPKGVKLVCQGDYVAESLASYMERHPGIDACCTRGGTTRFYTTEAAEKFAESASVFLRQQIEVESLELE